MDPVLCDCLSLKRGREPNSPPPLGPPAHWNHLDLVKAPTPRSSAAAAVLENLRWAKFLNCLGLHNKSLQNVDARNSKYLRYHTVSEGQREASLDGSGSVLPQAAGWFGQGLRGAKGPTPRLAN